MLPFYRRVFGGFSMRLKGMRLRIPIIVLFLLLTSLFATSASLSSANEEVLLTKTETPALAQFYATGDSSQDVCSSGVYTDTILLKNQGTLPDTYSITIEAADPLKDWIVVSDPVVPLAAGDEQTLSLYIKTPPSAQGTYSYKIFITSTYDGVQELEKTITAAPCATLALKAFTPTQKACACDVSVFLFELTNIGKAADKYMLWLEGIDTAYYELSDSVVRLQQGERTMLYAYTRLPCSTTGTFSLTVKAQTSFSDALVELPLSLETLDCVGSASTSEKSDDSSALYLLYTTYLFSTLAVLLLFAVLIVFFLFVKRTITDTVLSFIQKYPFLLPLCLGLFVLFLVIGAFTYPLVQQYYEEQQEENVLATEEIQEGTKDPLFTPWTTGAILAVVLVLLGILCWYRKCRSCCADTDANILEKPFEPTLQTSKKFVMQENKMGKETAVKAKLILKWCWISLLLLLFLTGLAVGLYYIYIEVSNIVVSDDDSEKSVPFDSGSEEHLEETDEELAALTASLQEMETNYATLEGQLNKMQEDIQTIDEKIEALTALIEQLQQSEETATEDALAEVQKEIDELQKEKDALEGALEEVQETAPVLVTIDTKETVQQLVNTQTNFKTVLLFDVSLSGQVEENGENRFSRGLELAKNYIEQDGRYTIMIVGKNAMIIKRDISADIAIRLLRHLRPLDTQSNLGKGLYAAAEDIGQNPGRIVLVSDLITTDGTDVYNIREELIKGGLDVVFLTLSSSKENLEEESTELEEAEENPVEEEEVPEMEETVQEKDDREEENSNEETTNKVTETAADEAASPVFDVEDKVQGNFVIEIPKDTAYRIDLNAYFVDEDADPLLYTATPGEHLSATVEENFVTLTSETAWIGETWVQFTADDSNGGGVESPVIRVVVSDNGTSTGTTNYIPWIILGSIIVLIIVSLISGAFAKKFHRDPGMPPEEES